MNSKGIIVKMDKVMGIIGIILINNNKISKLNKMII